MLSQKIAQVKSAKMYDARASHAAKSDRTSCLKAPKGSSRIAALSAESACYRDTEQNIYFLKRTILLHYLGRKMSILHIWCMDVSKTTVVSMQHCFKHSCSVRRRHWCRARYFYGKDYYWLWASSGVSEFFPVFLLESLVHWKVKASNHDLLMRTCNFMYSL